jgi:hypothetical protein
VIDVGVAVDAVRAVLRLDEHDRAVAAPKLGGVIIGDNLKLFDR